MNTTPLHLQAFDPQPFIARRNALIEQIRAAGGGVAIVPTAPETLRNGDAHHDYRPASSFYYLTGFCEPEAMLVLSVTANETKSILFCREKNIEREIWDGYRYGPEAAQQAFAMDACHAIEQLNQILPTLLNNQARIFAPLAHNTQLDTIIAQALNQSRSATRSGATAPTQWHDVDALIHESRLIKDSSEMAWLHAAGRISAHGHVRAMQTCQAGLRETDLEAEILYSFAKSGAQHAAYSSIVAAGANACVLHYRAGNAVLNDGDLCLIDAGAEYGFYAGDITRTFPVNGRFSAAQKAVYEVVLAAQNAAIAATRVGATFMSPHHAALDVLVDGMLDLKLLNKQQVSTRQDVIENGVYREFYMHRTSHWLGLDVHDAGTYSDGQTEGNQPIWRTLQSGMVLTIEPGLYIRPAKHIPEQYWNIGIRIEDDAIVTDNGCELTTRDVPVSVTDIEHLMKG
jgi:Xaa-Pro aminopeptidase